VAVIREGRLVALGHPDELRARTSGHRVEIKGSGFSESVLKHLLARPEVAAAEAKNSTLYIDFEVETDTSSLVSLLVGEGVQVEEVRRQMASLEDVFLTLMEEEK
jgi:ABC-2 type transport system ATP-binding protein